MQHLDSSGKLPSYVFVPSQRGESHDETMYFLTILCLVFELGMLSAASNRKSNRWIDYNNMHLPIMFRGRQFQDCPGSSTVNNFLTFCSAILWVLAFYPHACPHMVLRWQLSHLPIQGMRQEEEAALVCLENKSFWGKGEGTWKYSCHTSQSEMLPIGRKGLFSFWEISYADFFYYYYNFLSLLVSKKFLQDAGNELLVFQSSVSFSFSVFQEVGSEYIRVYYAEDNWNGVSWVFKHSHPLFHISMGGKYVWLKSKYETILKILHMMICKES